MAFALPLAACSAQSIPATAGKCGVSDLVLKRAMKEASQLQPYRGLAVGKCDVIVDSDSGGHVTVITPEIKRAVEKMD